MKKLLAVIIITFSFFSTFNFTNASNDLLDETLDLTYGPENFESNLPKVWNYYFKNKNNASTFKKFKAIDFSLRELIMENYRNKKYDFNAINGIVDNYTLFIFHTNKYFEYLAIREKNPKFSEVNTAILKNYKLSRSYLKKVKYIISLTNKKIRN